jgi:hypothetical protein
MQGAKGQRGGTKARPVLARAGRSVGGITHRLVSLKQYNTSAFVSRCEVVASMIEFDR